ncbi:hypothetical protein [Corynebacterium freiburgense]|uniref:hypothetical protein n=1 Tax=Corynebacterium freiburgense TaxID=556548 RepID=UPI0004218A6A|nr:hypothetical protein [Corynebacterium freiburgense]WJZ01505.1 hypothetical protein CFREI_00985 [Corynebacterium freiburgense]
MKFLSFATIFAAASGFILLWLVAGALGQERTAEFAAYWGLFFALTGLLDGLMQETTRAVSAARKHQPKTARPLKLGTLLAISTAVLVIGTGPFWIGLLLSSYHSSAVVLMAIGLVSYTYQAVLSGALSAMQLWKQYAWLVVLDSGIRLAIVVVAWLFSWGLFAYIFVTVIGACSWLVILGCSQPARMALRQPTDVDPPQFARRVAATMTATGASAALITGFPTLVKATSHESVGASVTLGGIIIAITLTRAPILVPLQRFQSALIVRFLHRPKALLQPLALVFGAGVIGAGAAWLIGPWIMQVFFRPDMFVPGEILAVLTFASACTGALMITGTAVLAHEQHRLYVGGWVLATVVAFGCLLLPFDLAVRVCLALTIGPLLGVIAHAGVLFATHQKTSPSASGQSSSSSSSGGGCSPRN